MTMHTKGINHIPFEWECLEDRKIYDAIPVPLHNSFWEDVLSLLLSEVYTRAEKKLILNRFAELLGTIGTSGWDDVELKNDAKRLMFCLQNSANANNYSTLLACLSCMVTKDSHTSQKLNGLLQRYGFRCQYTLETGWSVVDSVISGGKNLIFISHSSKDKKYVRQIVNLLEDIGLKQDEIFCTSIPEYAVPLGEDIYDFIRKRFLEYDLRVIYVLSENYYRSIPCLNEMGATWVLQKRYTSILLPGFVFEEMQGAVNAGKIGIQLDGDDDEVRHRFDQFRDILQMEFNFPDIPNRQWSRYLDVFLEKIKSLKKSDI